jgi:hypothetical protein
MLTSIDNKKIDSYLYLYFEKNKNIDLYIKELLNKKEVIHDKFEAICYYINMKIQSMPIWIGDWQPSKEEEKFIPSGLYSHYKKTLFIDFDNPEFLHEIICHELGHAINDITDNVFWNQYVSYNLFFSEVLKEEWRADYIGSLLYKVLFPNESPYDCSAYRKISSIKWLKEYYDNNFEDDYIL